MCLSKFIFQVSEQGRVIRPHGGELFLCPGDCCELGRYRGRGVRDRRDDLGELGRRGGCQDDGVGTGGQGAGAGHFPGVGESGGGVRVYE